jgi:hypothetical protein
VVALFVIQDSFVRPVDCPCCYPFVKMARSMHVFLAGATLDHVAESLFHSGCKFTSLWVFRKINGPWGVVKVHWSILVVVVSESGI